MYRNGILHQVAFSGQTNGKNPKQLPAGSISQDLPGISLTSDGGFILNPEDFARRVTQQIEADFVTFEGAASNAPPLAPVWAVPPGTQGKITDPMPVLATVSQLNLPTGYILGTSAPPSKSDGNAVGPLSCSIA